MSKKKTLGQYYTSPEIANFMVKLSSNKGKALDSGCGKGVFIKELLSEGFSKIKAYEIDKDSCQVCNKKYGDEAEIINKDYLKTAGSEEFNLIIGNPPYVHWNNIPEKIRGFLTKNEFWSKYVNGEWDLLYAFIIWSIEKLKQGGELIYIVPYNWFNATYAESLRDYMIKNGQFEIICHFSEFKLFDDCYPNNIIFKYRKTREKKKPLIFVFEYKKRKGDIKSILTSIKEEFKKIDHKSYEKEGENTKVFTMPNFKNKNMWYLATPTENKLINRIEKATGGVVLSDCLDIGVGMVSGRDEVFKIKDDELKGEFILSFIKASNCERYRVNSGTKYLLVDDIKTESELKKHPVIYKRLKDNEESLRNRYMSKTKNWWNWATVRNLKLFKDNLSEPKVFVPCIDRSLKPRFSYTEGEYYGAGDVLTIVKKQGLKEDLKYVLAWLNSDYINKWYRVKGSRTGHRIRYTQSYVSRIPLRLINWDDKKEVEIHNRIVGLVDDVLMGGEREDEINQLFEELI
ncbi:N-6 DNA methylase [archaeon]|nr:N-6 DNA methylase [archaeon]